MSIWICDLCMFSRDGTYHVKRTARDFDGMQVPHMEVCCDPCWDAFLAIDPEWDWRSEGWAAA